jgi:uncharacterized protein (DUF433 family)
VPHVLEALELTKDLRTAEPLYTVAKVARLVGMPASTLATWSQGYERVSPRRATIQGPVITSVKAPHPGGPTIPFVGLVEATVVQAFRRTALPLQRVRRALQVLSEQGVAHPLATKHLYTDGAQVLFDYAMDENDGQLRLLTVVIDGQRVFHEVIRDYLHRIHFDDSGPYELIVPTTETEILRVRPEVAHGDPVFVHGGAPLSAVVSRFRAGETIESLAVDYSVPEHDVEEALVGLGFATTTAA